MATLMEDSSPSPGNIVFFSIYKDKDLVHSYNGGDHSIQALALEWLDRAKHHHAWQSHTENNMTFGFLMRDGHTFFAIDDDAAAGNAEILSFLERLRVAYKNASAKDKVGEELNWVVRIKAGERSRNSSARSQLPGSTNDGRRSKDGGSAGGGVGVDKVLKIDGPAGGVISLSRSLSSRLMAQQRARKLWWRHVKIVAAFDVLLCSIMFAIWLVICEGFQCIS